MTLQPRCEDVETAEGVAITVTGVAQVRAHIHVNRSHRWAGLQVGSVILYLLSVVLNLSAV